MSSGRIITFYSYKGGTGRSMALANVAWILASQGRRVLMVDWDLEAPGLHLYVHPFLADKSLVASEGVIDLVSKFEAAAILPKSARSEAEAGANSSGADDPDWYRPFADISKYCIPLAWSFPAGGTLDLLPAGKQDQIYPSRVNSFNWASFYDRLGGGVFLEAVKDNMRRDYDYILIDSRTGVSDTAGVCTVQMPDTVVVCFTFNNQSIQGAAAVASSIQAQHQRVGEVAPGKERFRIFPVATRVDSSEKINLDRARELARRAFGGFIEHLPPDQREEYWGEVYVPYESFYAYQEVLATVADEPGLRGSILTSFERLAEFVTGEAVRKRSPVGEQRIELKNRFLLGPEPLRLRVILSNRPELQNFSDELTSLQKSWSETGEQGYLLTSQQIKRLQANIELMIAMLENPLFRKFWDASQEALRRQAHAFWVWVHGASLGIAIVLVGLVWALRGSSSGNISTFAMAALSAIGGSACSSLVSLSAEEESYERLPRISAAIFLLMIAAAEGLVVAVLLTAVSPSQSVPSTIALAFLLGFSFRKLVPEAVRSRTSLAEKDTRPDK